VLPNTTNGAGTVMVSPTVPTTYTLTVESPEGNDTAEVTIDVNLIGDFSADVAQIEAGGNVTLSWITRLDATTTISDVGAVDSGDSSIVVNPTETTTYVLTAEAGADSDTAAVTVFVQPAGELFAFLDIGATNGTPEETALDQMQLGAAPANTNNTNLMATTLTSETGVEFTITIDNVAPDGSPVGGLDWRDRGDSSGDLWTFLGEDHVKNNLGMIRITLSGVPAGVYDALSWHFDPTFSQCEAINILVTDANGTAVDTGVVGDASANPPVNTANNTTENMLMHLSQFSVESNGTDDIVIYFDGRTALDDEVPINGLWLSLAGEPVPLQIVDIEYNSGEGAVAIEFNSRQGRFYAIHASNDLTNWDEELDDSIVGQEGTTTFIEFGVDPSANPLRFYRVTEQ